MSGLRVTGGSFKGRVLEVPHSARPTGARLREALFSMWSGRIEGATFLDLFAGSGAVSVEALGRGASKALAIERDSRALGVLRRNAESLGLSSLRILPARLPGPGKWVKEGPFDLVYADPPYAFDRWPELLGRLAPALAEGARVACEHRDPIPALEGWAVETGPRAYGDSRLTILEKDVTSPETGTVGAMAPSPAPSR